MTGWNGLTPSAQDPGSGNAYLYEDTGALKYRGTSGTAATIVNADGTVPTSSGTVPTGGTTGQVLAKNSATDYDTGWATPSSGGMTLITSGNLSTGSSETSITNIPQTYTDLRIILKDVTASTGADGEININALTGAYYAYTRVRSGSSTVTSTAASTATSIPYATYATGGEAFLVIDIPDYTNSTVAKIIKWNFVSNSSNFHTAMGIATYRNSTAAVTSFQHDLSTGNTNSGSYEIWGIK